MTYDRLPSPKQIQTGAGVEIVVEVAIGATLYSVDMDYFPGKCDSRHCEDLKENLKFGGTFSR